MLGSGLFSAYETLKRHLIVGPGGLAAEILEIVHSLLGTFGGLAGIQVEEWDAPPAASASAVMPATATVSGSVTYTTVLGQLFNTAFAIAARNLVITGGGTTAQCPTSAVVTGYSAGGAQQTETIALTAGSGTGVKGWSKLVSIQFLGGTGVAGTEAVGTGVVIGLSRVPRLRAGQTSPLTPVFPVIVNGAVLTTDLGTIDTVNYTYTPNSAPNGTNSYALYYDSIAQ